MINLDKEIKFPEKKVDSGWKERTERDRVQVGASPDKIDAQAGSLQPTSPEFFNFLKSLATQALMSLGQIPNPMTGQAEVDPQTAKELIDLLSVLKVKTKGNCSPEEEKFFIAVLPELQLKFSQLA